MNGSSLLQLRQSLAYRTTCSVSSTHPGDVVELPPQLPSLQDGTTEEQHQQSVAEQQKKVCHDV